MFVPVSGEQVDLLQLAGTGYGETCEGTINVELLDYQGKSVDGSTYYWYDFWMDPEEKGDDPTHIIGWYDGSDEPVSAGQVTYAPGEAVWISGTAETEGLQSSGAVSTAPIDVYLRSGKKLIVNPTPVAVNYNDYEENGKFLAVGGYGDATYGSINAEKLTFQGKSVEDSGIYWYDFWTEDEPSEHIYGWYDGSDEKLESGALEPGETLWVSADSVLNKFNFPSAL